MDVCIACSASTGRACDEVHPSEHRSECVESSVDMSLLEQLARKHGISRHAKVAWVCGLGLCVQLLQLIVSLTEPNIGHNTIRNEELLSDC